MKKFFIALLLVYSLTVLTVHAEIKTYTGTDEYTIGEQETQADAKERSKQRAMRNAQEQAGVYISSYSRSKNFNLVDDEVLFITEGILKVVGAPNYKIIVLNDGKSMFIQTTITVEIDTDDLDRRLEEFEQRGKKTPETLTPQTRIPLPSQIETSPANQNEIKTFEGVALFPRLVPYIHAKDRVFRDATTDAYKKADKFVYEYFKLNGFDVEANATTKKQVKNFVRGLKPVNMSIEQKICKVTLKIKLKDLNELFKKIREDKNFLGDDFYVQTAQVAPQ